MNKNLELKHNLIKNNRILTIRITGMIIIGLLGIISLLGVFWGRESLIVVGVTFFIILILIIFVSMMVGHP